MTMDKHRPQYHFMPPANWMNDPNGLIQWDGTYHLFYQHNLQAAEWGDIHWGHATSQDLVHWQHLPVALAPTPGGPDHSGVWSGCAVDWNRTPTLVYTARDGEREHVCLATSQNHLLNWEKYSGNPVVVDPPPGLDLLGFRDPCVWNVDGVWFMALGTGIRGVGGAILLYSSANLTDWHYLGPMLVGDADQKDPLWAGEMWECPNFFPLGDRHILMISAMGIQPDRGLYTLYMAGEFKDYHFTPEVMTKMDGGDIYFYAPQAFLDEQGRRIVLGWARESRSREAQLAAGWAGVMTLPRLLEWRPDGWMGQRPVPELEALRGPGQSWSHLVVKPGQMLQPEGLNGDCLELEADFNLGEIGGDLPGAFGLLVRRSPDGQEQTEIRIDRQAECLVVDNTHSSLTPEVETGCYDIPLDLSGLDHLNLRVFLDHSMIEVYANGLAVITCRVYPSRDDSTGIAFFGSDQPLGIENLRIWPMRPIW